MNAWFIVGVIGVFMAGCSFQSALYGNGILFGAIPPAASAVISLIAVVGWITVILDADK